jgi:hypothetical protein
VSELRDLVEKVREIPYGRASERTSAAVLAEGRGTCSTKHLLLQERARERVPDADVRLVHRVYRLTPADAEHLFGEGAAAALPVGGLVDVHTYATALVGGRRVTLDVTFPGTPPWDGRSDMPLACGPGSTSTRATSRSRQRTRSSRSTATWPPAKRSSPPWERARHRHEPLPVMMPR